MNAWQSAWRNLMSKRAISLFALVLLLLLTACGSKPSWENENVAAASARMLSDDVVADWQLVEDPKAAGTDRHKLIRLVLKRKDGTRINEFDYNHEKLLHLIVVSKDLSYFNHIHPEYQGNGLFQIANDFPAGGEYRLIADFKPSEGDAMSKMAWVQVDGEAKMPTPIVPDTNLDKKVDGKEIKLTIDRLAANQDLTLRFFLTDVETGQPINDLEPYLGAIGHVVVLSEDGEQYMHVHADDGQGTGPEAIFETSFPKSGIYKIWAQFQQHGQVFTVPFVVKVP